MVQEFGMAQKVILTWENGKLEKLMAMEYMCG
jgi:hypothetical protein